MNIFICGLGLIGGSIAKAVKAHTFHTVIGFDRDADVCRRAEAEGVIDRAGQPRDLAECDIVIVALYPDAAAAFVGENPNRTTAPPPSARAASMASTGCPAMTC